MPITHFDGLKEEIRIWCNRSPNDTIFVEAIPSFIRLAEWQLFHQFQVLGMQVVKDRLQFYRNIIGNLSGRRWSRNINLIFIDNKNIRHIFQKASYDVVCDLANSQDFSGKAMTDEQKHNIQYKYCDYVDDYDMNAYPQIMISFIPDFTWNIMNVEKFQAIFYDKPTELSVYKQTNYYTDYLPDTLFFLSLAQAYKYLGSLEKSQYYEGQAKGLMNADVNLDTSRLLDRNSDLSMSTTPS